MRLIDANALKKLRHDYIQGRIKFTGSEYDLIDKCPTIEAEPVKHGEWVSFLDGDDIMPERRYRCSKCGRVERQREPYCHCGAKMDGGKAE